MSYDIDLINPDGTICKEASLKVTYNYSECYCIVDGFNIRDLDRKKAGDTIEILEKVIKVLGDKTYRDYWAPTPGNAGHAAAILLRWARKHPNATWEVH